MGGKGVKASTRQQTGGMIKPIGQQTICQRKLSQPKKKTLTEEL